MKRRNFIQKLGFAAGVPIAFQGVPIQVLASDKPLQRLAAQSTNDNVLIILQMHGGNDGLNTFIPLGNYDEYYSRRANIAIPYKSGNRTLIPLDSTVAEADQVGLHPDMQAFKDMYDAGKAAVFQGVSYERNNGSHFRGRDIWFMGGDVDDYYSSGWIGRYLNQEYAPLQYPQDFPNDNMPDPLALEMGNDVSLLFHQTGNIPTSISLGGSPNGIAGLIDQLSGYTDDGVDPRGLPPSFLDGSPYGKEMDWILGLEDKSETYIRRLVEIYNNSGETKATYPEKYPFQSQNSGNPLSQQLQLVARLLEGGIKTKVFLVKIGGFDTHASQTESYDPTMGNHAALLFHISEAMKAFNTDLINRGLHTKVLTVSMSEFGRRIGSNGSYGTDHGTGGPVMMFGAGVNPGIYGTNPDMSANNVGMQFDYRQLYAGILHEWLGVEKSVITNDIFFGDYISGPNPNGGNYEPLDLIKETITGTDDFLKSKFNIQSIYPNPATQYAQANILVNDYQNVGVELIDVNGRVVQRLSRSVKPGKHTFTFQLNNTPPGIYFVKAKSEKLNDTKRLIIRK
ncbi:MAG: hypothetical protein CMB80_29715 [Flammeovirgaceae bacterium]|nr:hypothetical protein [Flammeovirgaceae bacterium]MBE61613.1 hypothetical protein [Flammeovirgaceae bacterium]MBR10245.1 hypothetical protein [Rickettsiales bacterium]HCX22852.1 hypothetical protein [Cytophagales bacterium]|tara:strand:- start:4584 stop:6281 length:1698 start_codon:yes stop_codon:yes gene_type:complete